jgi:hypothetical protein
MLLAVNAAPWPQRGVCQKPGAQTRKLAVLKRFDLSLALTATPRLR